MKTPAIVVSLFLLFFAAQAYSGGSVTYFEGDTTLKGYLSSPKGDQKRPAVLVVHEWWGLNDYAKMRADQLAELGYVSLAVDMYGDGINTTDPKKAGELSGAIGKNPALAVARFNAALEYLKKNSNVDPDSIAAIGYCFGGTTVLTMARKGTDLKGVVSFHGGLAPVDKPAAPGDIKAKVLVCHGGADPFVTKEQFDAFLDEMTKSGAEWEVNVYGKARHSFTNPASDKAGVDGLGYNQTADYRSWEHMKSFLSEIFGMD